MQIRDVDSLGGKASDGQLRDFPGLVDRIVEHLNFEQIPWILNPADRLDQPFDDIHLVVQRELDGDRRQRLEVTQGDRVLVLVLHVQVDKVVTVPPVHCQDDQDEEVRREDEGFNKRHDTVRSRPVCTNNH